MNTVNYIGLSDEELGQLITKFTLDQLQSEISKMRPNQVAIVVFLLNEKHDSNWREKLIAICKGIENREAFEAAGQVLSLMQLLEIINFAKSSDIGYEYLNNLFTGISSDLFKKTLLTASSIQIGLLKKLCHLEPLQYQLINLIHTITSEKEKWYKDLEVIRLEISQLKPAELRWDHFQSMLKKMSKVSDECVETLEILSKALLLAWNVPHRPDLIEKMTSLKEELSHLQLNDIGHLENGNFVAFGIYESLYQHLNAIYENLDHNDLAIDGLARLSIWNIQDYVDVGLLSKGEIKNEEVITERVQTKLEKLGLSNVASLIAAHIYSREMLKDYLIQNKLL